LFRRHRSAPVSAWTVFPIAFAFVFFTHFPLLRLPYFWDEAGYYIPAAYDFFRTGTLIPYSTLSNAHPPLPAIYLAWWWKACGFSPMVTRIAVCVVAAFALTGIFLLARRLSNAQVALATTLLTAIYPVWFAQSTLAQADIYAAAATLWALYFALDETLSVRRGWFAALWFSVGVLSKETAIVTPVALAFWHVWEMRRKRTAARAHGRVALQLAVPILPLAAWYGYYFRHTGHLLGNPQYVQYNAVGTLDPVRFLLAFGERIFQLTIYMNLFVPVLCTLAAMFLLPALLDAAGVKRPRVSWNAQAQIGVILLANVIFFSIFGGAVLARYLLPLYPLILLLCVSTWRRRVRGWLWIAALSVVAFVAGLFVNPPYRFAPEDNLAYRSMIVLQQKAIHQVLQRAPGGTVLTAWPATDELTRPELGYVWRPVRVVAIDDFSLPQVVRARQRPVYDAALVFSTKVRAEGLPDWLRFGDRPWNRKYFGYHRDLPPKEIARLLGGETIWEDRSRGLWSAVIVFNRPQLASISDASHGLSR
jgi:4-amino-4-deoxy-L-arabinose transferase-like glycosyltransferase